MWIYVTSCSVRWPKSLAFAIRLNSYSRKVSQLMPREENDRREQLQVYYFQRGQIYSENGHWESLIALVCSDQMWKVRGHMTWWLGSDHNILHIEWSRRSTVHCMFIYVSKQLHMDHQSQHQSVVIPHMMSTVSRV